MVVIGLDPKPNLQVRLLMSLCCHSGYNQSFQLYLFNRVGFPYFIGTHLFLGCTECIFSIGAYLLTVSFRLIHYSPITKPALITL